MFSVMRAPLFLAIVITLAGLACKQYEYASPTPGILEVRLAVKNTLHVEFIPFGVLDSTNGNQNRFFTILHALTVLQPGGLRLPIYATANAIRRNPDGDFFNSLDVGSRDSIPVLGVVYAPPGTYTGFEINISVIAPIFIYNPPVQSAIDVVRLPPFIDQLRLPVEGQPPVSIPIHEGRNTRVTITFDLDQALIQRAEWYDYRPAFYVSSVQEF